MVLDTIHADLDEVAKIKERYLGLKSSGDLDRKLARLMKKQKRATTTNGPHPHYVPQPSSASSQQQTENEQPSSFREML